MEGELVRKGQNLIPGLLIDDAVTYRFFENNAAARRRVVVELLQPAGATTKRSVNKALIRPTLPLKGNVSSRDGKYII